jgi:hypothetical protein
VTTSISKYQQIPILGPILLLLASPELILALIAVLLDYVITQRPELAEFRAPMLAATTSILGLFMAGLLTQRLKGYSPSTFWRTVWAPISLILHSRRFWYAVGAVIASVLVALMPELKPIQTQLVLSIAGLGITLIGTTAWEDTSKNKSTPPDAQSAPVPTSVTGLTPEDAVNIVQSVLPILLQEFNIVPKPGHVPTATSEGIFKLIDDAEKEAGDSASLAAAA